MSVSLGEYLREKDGGAESVVLSAAGMHVHLNVVRIKCLGECVSG